VTISPLICGHITYWLTYLFTYSMEQSPSWEATRFSASQEIPCILRNMKVHYWIHKCPPPVPILSQLVLHPTSWRCILLLSSQTCLGLPSGLFSPGILAKTLYMSLLYPIRPTCPVHLILLDLTTRTIFGEEYRLLSSSLSSFLSHSPVTSSSLDPNILLSIVLSNTFSLRSSVNVNDHVSHPYLTICGHTVTKNEILTTVLVNIRNFSDITQCPFTNNYRLFGTVCCFLLLPWRQRQKAPTECR